MKSKDLITVSVPGPSVTLAAAGDWHWGHERCNEEGVLATLKHIEETGALVLGMGDYGDYGLTSSIGASAYEQTKTPQDQADEVEDLLRPVARQVIGLITGNHEERIRKKTSYDITRSIARNLNIPYLGFGAVIRLTVGRRGFTIFAKHGSSGAGTVSGKINAVMAMRSILPEADLYMMGHVHDLIHIAPRSKKYNTRYKRLDPAIQHFVLTGHYLDYEDSYAEEKGYYPGNQGTPFITFTEDGNIHVEL